MYIRMNIGAIFQLRYIHEAQMIFENSSAAPMTNTELYAPENKVASPITEKNPEITDKTMPATKAAMLINMLDFSETI